MTAAWGWACLGAYHAWSVTPDAHLDRIRDGVPELGLYEHGVTVCGNRHVNLPHAIPAAWVQLFYK